MILKIREAELGSNGIQNWQAKSDVRLMTGEIVLKRTFRLRKLETDFLLKRVCFTLELHGFMEIIQKYS